MNRLQMRAKGPSRRLADRVQAARFADGGCQLERKETKSQSNERGQGELSIPHESHALLHGCPNPDEAGDGNEEQTRE